MSLLPLSGLHEGTELPEVKRSITQEKINLYAQASRDFNPIHVDEEFARNTPLGGTIAHGMLILAYVSQMMTLAFAQSWVAGGKLNVRFRAPARPGDTVTVRGKVSKLERSEGEITVKCEIQCCKQTGEPVITGDARLTVKSS